MDRKSTGFSKSRFERIGKSSLSKAQKKTLREVRLRTKKARSNIQRYEVLCKQIFKVHKMAKPLKR